MVDLVKEILKIAAFFEQQEGYSKETKDPDVGETSHQRKRDQRKRKAKERGSSTTQSRVRGDTQLNTRDTSDPDLKADL